MKNARVILVIAVFFQSLAVVHADGGTVRFSERRGDYRITVFTAPTPLRAGPVDVSVFVQHIATGEPVPDARITVRAAPREDPEEVLWHLATSQAATNKLYQAAVFVLPKAGWWDVAISIDGLAEPIEMQFEMVAEQPLPRVWEMTPWITWPAVVVFLFVIHQWQVQRKQSRTERKK